MTSEQSKMPPALLIAEDEIMLRAIAAEMLRDAGLTVFEAANGVEALELLEANPQIGLLISDIKMPRMNGYELVEAATSRLPDLKVLLLTGYAEPPPTKTLRRPDIKVMHKPFDLEKLCAIAQNMLGSAADSSGTISG